MLKNSCIASSIESDTLIHVHVTHEVSIVDLSVVLGNFIPIVTLCHPVDISHKSLLQLHGFCHVNIATNFSIEYITHLQNDVLI